MHMYTPAEKPSLHVYGLLLHLRNTLTCVILAAKRVCFLEMKEDCHFPTGQIKGNIYSDFIDQIVRFSYNKVESKILYLAQGGCCMLITATEFKNNIGKYLALASAEDIYITKNGKSVAKLTNINQDKVEMAKSLFGILPADASLEQAREERLSRHERID